AGPAGRRSAHSAARAATRVGEGFMAASKIGRPGPTCPRATVIGVSDPDRWTPTDGVAPRAAAE
ncbi:MAG: hypothetical protein ACRDG9_10515, partial [Actinomycetota bacterium]